MQNFKQVLLLAIIPVMDWASEAPPRMALQTFLNEFARRRYCNVGTNPPTRSSPHRMRSYAGIFPNGVAAASAEKVTAAGEIEWPTRQMWAEVEARKR